MTTTEIIDLFKTPLTTFKQGSVLQKILLGSCANSNETLSSKRALALLETTELRSLFLLVYPHITLTDLELDDAAELTEIKKALLPYVRVVIRAISELEAHLPIETTNLLRDYLVKESPLHFVTVTIFIVVTMALLEVGEL